MKKYNSSGFTLVELLVVIAIIGVLAAMVLQTAGYVQKKGATSRAEAEIAGLSAALENYKAEMGDYPEGTATNNTTNTNDGINQFLRAALSPATGKVFFEFPKGMGPKGADLSATNVVIMDPWGKTYCYQYPGDTNRNGTNFFDLWTPVDGGTNTNQWIKNW